jgi:2-C-methyl-D-erythritol 2,4-cyclodiphosphate synthase
MTTDIHSDDPPLRIGHGYDLHRLAPLLPTPATPAQPPRPLVIGGIPIEHTHGTVSHSDGDVLLHAITDALLGALCLPDIGQLFPDHDPQWAGANSEHFLAEARRLAIQRGWRIANLDTTVILERPRIGPRKDEIRRNLARILALPPDRINLKAKTHESVDAVGEGRAIEAHAVVLLARA